MITFKCQCGKVLKVKDEAAGKRVRCPACSTIVQVPAAGPAPPPPEGKAEPLRDASGNVLERPEDDADFGLQDYAPEHGEHEVAGGGKHCPACHMLLPQSAIICTTCGYDFRTGKVYAPPQTVVQKVPWKLLVKWGIQIALLALVVGLGWWAYTLVKSRQSGPEAPEKKDVGGTSEELRKRARIVKRKPPIRVVTKTTYLKPKPPDALALRAADGPYTASKACSLLRAKLAEEARGRLRVAGHKVVKPGGKSDLKLRLELTVGWTFAERGGKLVPAEPCITWCNATIVRGDDDVLWPAKGDKASYTAKRPGPEPDKDAAAAIAALAEAETEANLEEATARTAATVVGKVLSVVPPPSFLAKLMSESGKPEARGRLAPHERLLGPLRHKFAAALGSFAAELPVVKAAAEEAPHVALAFAKTAARLDDDPAVRQAFAGLCTRLEPEGRPPPREQGEALRTLAREHADALLGCAALWTLVASNDRSAWILAERYLLEVAGGEAPALGTGPDGQPRLDPLQVDVLRHFARHKPDDAPGVAVALLLRARGDERRELEPFLKLSPADPDVVRHLDGILASASKRDLVSSLKRDVPSGARGRPYAPRLIDAYHRARDPDVRATRLYVGATTARRDGPSPAALLDMRQSPTGAARRAAANAFHLAGTSAGPFVAELKAALASETDSATRSRLRSAIERAQTRL